MPGHRPKSREGRTAIPTITPNWYVYLSRTSHMPRDLRSWVVPGGTGRSRTERFRDGLGDAAWHAVLRGRERTTYRDGQTAARRHPAPHRAYGRLARQLGGGPDGRDAPLVPRPPRRPALLGHARRPGRRPLAGRVAALGRHRGGHHPGDLR